MTSLNYASEDFRYLCQNLLEKGKSLGYQQMQPV
jgi:hypothetical protein